MSSVEGANLDARPIVVLSPYQDMFFFVLLLAGDAEAREKEYMANGPYTDPLTIISVPKLHTA